MRVALEQQRLARNLRVAERIVPSKGNLPFNYAVHVSVNVGGSVQMHVSNGKEGYAWRMTAIGSSFEDGDTSIPAAELMRCVRVAPGEVVVIEEHGQNELLVASGTARWTIKKLQGVEVMDWYGPEWGVDAGDPIDRDELMQALENVNYAASRTELHPSLQQVSIAGGQVIAGDGRRMHAEAVLLGQTPATAIPIRNVDTAIEALGAIEQGEHEMFVRVDPEEGSVCFTDGVAGAYVVTMLTYPFPDLESMVMSQARAQEGTVSFTVSTMITALKVATVGSGENVILRFTDGVIEVEGHGVRAEGRMEVQADTAGVESGTEFAVVASDILDLLGRVEGDEVEMRVSDGEGSLYVSGDGMEAAIKPVRV